MELRGANKYRSWYTKNREEALEAVINDNILDLFKKFKGEQQLKARIELE